MYGQFDEINSIIYAHTIYEPRDENSYKEEEEINKIAEYLGLYRVGIIVYNSEKICDENLKISGKTSKGIRPKTNYLI
jgi:hypothetical protein